MNCTQAKKIKIENYLKSKNIYPVDSRRQETVLIYKAPYRKEKRGSLEVDTQKNIWFDHGTGKGGNIIDLVIKVENITLNGALEKLSQKNFDPFSFYQQKRKPGEDQDTKTEIINITSLTNKQLLDYIIERKISVIISTIYLKEITYRNSSSKTWKALGFRNDKSGYEFRSKTFQGCTSKYFTTITGISNMQLNIYEGFFDFLSAIELSKKSIPKFNSLILNSVGMKEKTLDIIQKYDRLNLFLDNDAAGNIATKYFQTTHGNVVDYSKTIYPNNKDLNEYLMQKKKP